MIKFNKLWLFAILLLFVFTACSKDDNDNKPKDKTAVEVLDEIMEEWYLWNDELPALNVNNYNDLNTYFNDLLVDQDKWSFIANLDALLAFLNNGTYTGYGFDLQFEEGNNTPRVSLVYDQSQLYDEGITRSWKLLEINNQSTNSMTENEIRGLLSNSTIALLFENNSGEQKSLNLSKKEMNQNTVIKRSVIQTLNKKVAYLVFDSFLGSSEAELNEAFDYFNAEGAEELVLDMRYNGGGSTDIANQLAGLISGNAYQGKIFSKYIFNESKTSENFNEAFSSQASAYGFNRIFVITTSATASASELVINSLKPYMGAENIKLIGSTTHGKPVGMNVFQVPEFNLAILPITFHITDENGDGYYFNGIPVDHEVEDDITHDWGDIDESNLKAALDYINNDAFPAVTARAKKGYKREFVRKGLDELISAF
ncbi:S41 family peptidase [Ancylomarina sp.]|uniref:S41 family peptidase n=1 Tax=Ancylomarina sp. TaxID=1970196 RepID=UPI003566FD23